MLILRQANGTELSLPDVPRRIVSLVPSVTENLILFGVAPVGRTSFCIEPRDAVASIAVVGGTKTPNLKKIAALAPDLVIANKEENRREDVGALCAAGIPVWVTYPVDLEGTLALMEDLARLAGNGARAREILEESRACLARLPAPGTVRAFTFAVPIWRDPWMLAGSDTYVAHLVSRVGGRNVAPAPRYPEVTLDGLVAARPDVVLLPSEPYAFAAADAEELNARFGRPVAVLFNGEDLCWSGPRMPRALQDLAALREARTAA